MSDINHLVLLFRFPNTLWRAGIRFSDHNGLVVSSHVAMSLMLALFPFVLFIVALAGVLSQGLDTGQLTDLLFRAWPPEIATPLVRELNSVLQNDNTSLLTLGGALALYFASNGVEAIRVAINSAYRDEETRPFWKNRVVALTFVMLGSVIILAGLALSLGLPAYVYFISDVFPDAVADWMNNLFLQRAVPVLLLVFAVASFHVWLPAKRRRFSQVWPGVLVTILLWAVAVSAFSYYISTFANYSATYAGLAGVMTALIFFYLLAIILIYGAEVNGVLSRRAAELEAASSP